MSIREAGPVAQVLIDGHKLFQDPKNWCKYQDHEVRGHLWWRHDAYCAVGYMEARLGSMGYGPSDNPEAWAAFGYLNKASLELSQRGFGPMAINDVLGREATVAMYKRAAEFALAEGK